MFKVQVEMSQGTENLFKNTEQRSQNNTDNVTYRADDY
jgi:hypothetical protein